MTPQQGLPLLAQEPGVDCGLMIAQYTAAAPADVYVTTLDGPD